MVQVATVVILFIIGWAVVPGVGVATYQILGMGTEGVLMDGR